MGHLTKRDLVIRISSETGMIQTKVALIIERLLDEIVSSLGRGQEIELRDFGCLRITKRKARPGRNPLKPQHCVTIPEYHAVKFRASKELNARVLKLTGTLENKRVPA